MPPSRIRWAAALLALAFIAIAAIASSGSEGNGKEPSRQGQADTSEATAPSEYSNIYAVRVENRVPFQLTDNRDEQFAESPSWSKAGKIVFAEPECEPCPSTLFEMDPDGRGRKRIPSDVSNLYQPSSSPDGRRVAAAKPGSGIYLIDVGDGGARRVSSGESDEAPAWSPDGKLILFHRQVTAGNWDIYGVRPDGGPLRRLTRDPLQQLHPAWSPDGTKIAFTEQQRNGNWVIFSMRLDGSRRRQLTDLRHSSQEPSWSPDGTRIALIVQREGHATIAVMDADGGSRKFLTGRSLAVSGPAWSPDGKKVLFGAQKVQKGTHH